MIVLSHGTSMVDGKDVRKEGLARTDTEYRKMCEMAVGLSLYRSGLGSLVGSDVVGGIVGTTDFGDRYPELCLEKAGRIRPSSFGSSVLNSGIGHCAVKFGLTGPQILLTRSSGGRSAKEVAVLQLEAGRADLMVVLAESGDGSLASTVFGGASLIEGVPRW